MSIITMSEALKTAFLPYIKNIQDFHFYYNNPLLWAFFMVLYLLLEIGKGWSPGKAFFFCASIASILLGATQLAAKTFTIQGYAAYSIDPFILKVASLILISLVIVYFVLIDNS
ncbi:MAG: hypothetical protein NTX47_05730 [Candidatus Omnitrophica bacterium]|nr:hypothetical protein [Candidatus Omnitrophota bacterium]